MKQIIRYNYYNGTTSNHYAHEDKIKKIFDDFIRDGEIIVNYGENICPDGKISYFCVTKKENNII